MRSTPTTPSGYGISPSNSSADGDEMGSRDLDLSNGAVKVDLDVRGIHGEKSEPPIQIHRWMHTRS